MNKIKLNWITFSSEMTLYSIRKRLFNYYNKLLTDKIRVYSLIYKSSKYICEKIWIEFKGYFLAIGEFNYKSFSYDLQEKWGFLINWENYNNINEKKMK